MNAQYALLLDGGFVTKVLEKKLGKRPEAGDVVALCTDIQARKELAGLDLLRIYFYDAPPATGKIRNPISLVEIDLSATAVHAKSKSLHDKLELEPFFALRMGETAVRGWKLGPAAERDIIKTRRTAVAGDLIPDIEQKGVDLRIGLDMARLALKSLVRVIVVVTGDSDLVPAFKFARREGVRVYLDALGASTVRRGLRAHSDLVF